MKKSAACLILILCFSSLGWAEQNKTLVHQAKSCGVDSDKLQNIVNYLTCIESNTLGACALLGAYAAGRIVTKAALNQIIKRFEKEKARNVTKLSREIFQADRNRARQLNLQNPSKYNELANAKYADLPDVARKRYERLAKVTLDEVGNLVKRNIPLDQKAIASIEDKILRENYRLLHGDKIPGNFKDQLGLFEKARANALADRSIGYLLKDEPDSSKIRAVKHSLRGKLARAGFVKRSAKAMAKVTALRALALMSLGAAAEIAFANNTACSATTEQIINGSPPDCGKQGPLVFSERVLDFISELEPAEQESLLQSRSVCRFYTNLYDILFNSYTIKSLSCGDRTAKIEVSTKDNLSYTQNFEFRSDGSVIKVETYMSIFDSTVLALLRKDQQKEARIVQFYNGQNEEISAKDLATDKSPVTELHTYINATTDLYYTEVSACCLQPTEELRRACTKQVSEDPLSKLRRKRQEANGNQ